MGIRQNDIPQEDNIMDIIFAVLAITGGIVIIRVITQRIILMIARRNPDAIMDAAMKEYRIKGALR
jgi:hypothetical protein